MRAQAGQAPTEELRRSCLRAAEAYDILAENAGAAEPDDGDRE